MISGKIVKTCKYLRINSHNEVCCEYKLNSVDAISHEYISICPEDCYRERELCVCYVLSDYSYVEVNDV